MMKNAEFTNLLQKSSIEAKKLKQFQTFNHLKRPKFNINLDPINLALNSTMADNKTYLTKKGYNYINKTLKNTSPTNSVTPINKKGRANIYPYLLNNINHISLTPFIGVKNGVLLKYQKIISYKFNTSNSILTPFALDLQRVRAKETEDKISSNALSNLKGKGNIGTSLINPGNLGAKVEIKQTSELLYYFFKSIYCLISKPVYLHSSDKVIIQLFYYLCIPKKKVFKFFSIKYISSFKNKWLKKKSQAFSIRKNNKILPYSSFKGRGNKSKSAKLFIKWRVLKSISRLRSKSNYIRKMLFNLRKFNLSKVFKDKFFLISKILSQKFNKAVEFQLIRLHHPYHDSNILINLLSLNIKNKKKNARNAINKIYGKNQIIPGGKNINDPNLKSINNIPAFLSGIYVKIAGRLMREPIIPRLTTKIYERGASSTGKVNYLDVATITKKNKKGAYTIKIKSGQNFYPLIHKIPNPNSKKN